MMRIFLLLLTTLALSACASGMNMLQPLTPEQSAAIEQECGRIPVSVFKSHVGTRKILYRACKRETLQAIEKANNVS